MNATPPTLRQIAQRAGCSHITVSRALRGAPGVSEKKAKQIQVLAAEMGFKNNPLVAAWMQRIRKGGTRLQASLAFLSAYPADERKGHYPTVEILQGANLTAKQLGFHLTVFSPEDLSKRNPQNQLMARGIQGVIVGPAPYHSVCPPLDWTQFSLVTLGYSYPELHVDRITSDSFGSMQYALNLAKRLGAKSPALIIESERDERLRYQISAAFLQKVPGASTKNIFPWEGNGQMLVNWLKKRQPDAIICAEHSALQNISKTVPVIYMGGVDPGEDVHWIPRNFYHMGVTAMEMISSKVIRNERGLSAHPRTVLIEDLYPTQDIPVSKS